MQRWIGSSEIITATLEQVSSLAAIDRPVLVLGERGTGKELIAERLHFLSSRWEQQFLKVNCAAISEPLLESELFGYEPGAFTGATKVHRGRFERAHNGTLFLDEVGTMSSRLQEKLLRVIEYGEFERLGGQKTQSVDVRLIAATNAPLQNMAQRGDFREDLLDRLAFDVVHVPPLRLRKEDIPELADFFGVKMSQELHWELYPGFSDAALESLCRHDWPGNVRELRNAIERSVFRWGDESKKIDAVNLDPFVLPFDTLTKIESVKQNASEKDEAKDTSEPFSFKTRVQNFERNLLQRALRENHFNQKKTAIFLSLTYDQLRGILRKYPDLTG